MADLIDKLRGIEISVVRANRALLGTTPVTSANVLVRAAADRLEAQEALLREAMEALGKLHHAVCGETGFAQCVRVDSKTLYPWPALDVADHAARATLAKLQEHLEGGGTHP